MTDLICCCNAAVAAVILLIRHPYVSRHYDGGKSFGMMEDERICACEDESSGNPLVAAASLEAALPSEVNVQSELNYGSLFRH